MSAKSRHSWKFLSHTKTFVWNCGYLPSPPQNSPSWDGELGKMLSVLIYTEPANDIKESLTFSPEFPPDGKSIKGGRFLVVN